MKRLHPFQIELFFTVERIRDQIDDILLHLLSMRLDLDDGDMPSFPQIIPPPPAPPYIFDPMKTIGKYE